MRRNGIHIARSRIVRRGSLRAAALALALVLCASNARADVRADAWADGAQLALATVAGEAISADLFRARYVDYLRRTGVQDTPQMRLRVLEQLVANRLMVRGAEAEGIAAEAGYQFERERARRKLLVDAFVARAIYDTVRVAERDLAEMHVRINTTLRARHLYARTREEADRLYARVQAGETFEDLAREVFADTALANHGGSVGTFGFDEMDPAFEDAAFALRVGEVSAPVRTAQGYSIIQLQDRFTHPLLTEADFARRRKKLEGYVLQRKRTEARAAFLHRLAGALDVAFDEAALDRLLAQVTGRAVETDEAWLAGPLVSFTQDGRRRTWTVDTFREAAHYTDEAQRAQVRTRADLVDFVVGLVARHVVLDRARAARLDADPAFAAALDEAMEDYVVRRVYEQIAAETVVPEDSLRAAYEAHRAGLMEPERVRVWEIMTDTKAEADRLKALLPGPSFEALARAHSVRPGADATGGDLGWLDRETLGVLADAVWEAPEGAVVGPLGVAGRYVLLKVGPRQAPRPMDYADARPHLQAQLHRQMARARLDAHVRALRERYAVTIDRERLAALPLRAAAR